MVTFRDLYDLIQKADRDSFGYFEPYPNQKFFPKYYIHIYDGRRQANLCRKEEGEEVPTSIANFVFIENGNEVTDVQLFNVKNGVADYDHPVEIPVSLEITGVNLKSLHNGGLVTSCLQDIIPEFK